MGDTCDRCEVRTVKRQRLRRLGNDSIVRRYVLAQTKDGPRYFSIGVYHSHLEHHRGAVMVDVGPDLFRDKEELGVELHGDQRSMLATVQWDEWGREELRTKLREKMGDELGEQVYKLAAFDAASFEKLVSR